MKVERKLSAGLVAACLLLGAGDRGAASGPIGAAVAASQAGVAGPNLLPVMLPDLGRAHASVQAQLREAHASLIALEPGERSHAYGQLGKLLLAGEYLDEAERCFRNAQTLAPGDFRWSYYLAHVVRSTGRLTEAVEHFERALRLRPDDLAALTWLGQVHVDAGRPEVAEPLLTRARALHPDTPALLFQLGRAAAARRDYAGAAALLEDALRLNPAATAIRYPLAMAYRGLGDLERAQSYLDRRGGRRRPARSADGGCEHGAAEPAGALGPRAVRRRAGRLGRGGGAVPGGGSTGPRPPRRPDEPRPGPEPHG